MNTRCSLRSITLAFTFLCGSRGAAHAENGRPDYLVGSSDEEYVNRSSVACVGDVNGDGHGDFALSNRSRYMQCEAEKRGCEPALDRVWIASGKDGALLRTLRPPRPVAAFGRVLESVGDMDGDGFDELAVGGGECVWVYSARDGALVHELGKAPRAKAFYQNVAGGRDLDGDGFADTALFLEFENEFDALSPSSRVEVYSGTGGGLLCVVSVAPTHPEYRHAPGAKFVELQASALTPAIALAPDRNGDGRAELLVDSFPPPRAAGYARISDRFEGELSEDNTARLVVIDPLAARQLDQLTLQGSRGAHAQTMRSLPDVNQDGVPEVLLGSIYNWAAVHCGRTGAKLHSRNLQNAADMSTDFTSLALMDDFDADGVRDFLSAENESNSAFCNGGGVTIHSGATGKVLAFRESPMEPEDATYVQRPKIRRQGIDACSIADVDGDGLREIAICVPALREVRVLSGKGLRELWRAPLLERFLSSDAKTEH